MDDRFAEQLAGFRDVALGGPAEMELRVALALTEFQFGGKPWKYLDPSERQFQISAARYAIRAMHEATPEMIDAGGREIAAQTQMLSGARHLERYSSPDLERANRDRARAAWEGMTAAASPVAEPLPKAP